MRYIIFFFFVFLAQTVLAGDDAYEQLFGGRVDDVMVTAYQSKAVFNTVPGPRGRARQYKKIKLVFSAPGWSSVFWVKMPYKQFKADEYEGYYEFTYDTSFDGHYYFRVNVATTTWAFYRIDFQQVTPKKVALYNIAYHEHESAGSFFSCFTKEQKYLDLTLPLWTNDSYSENWVDCNPENLVLSAGKSPGNSNKLWVHPGDEYGQGASAFVEFPGTITCIQAGYNNGGLSYRNAKNETFYVTMDYRGGSMCIDSVVREKTGEGVGPYLLLKPGGTYKIPPLR